MKHRGNKAPELKSERELDLMRAAGKVVAEALRTARSLAKPGVRTIEIDEAVDEIYHRHGATPLFKNYPGKVPFPGSTCISLNEQVVHGIPGQRMLRKGDIVKVDTACKLEGWCADAAVCIIIGEVREELRDLVDTARECLQTAITELGRRKYWSEVAAAMYRMVKKSKYSTVEQFVGHGIGRTMHEAPQVPNYTSADIRRHDCRLEPGLVLAIEPMINLGRKEVVELPDHWTIITRDRLPSAHVEHTVAITNDGVEVLTAHEVPV